MKFHLGVSILIWTLGLGCATARDYCPAQPKPLKEGDPWYIAESAFTKEAANKAIANLNTQIEHDVSGRDFDVDNDLKMIKGYLYRVYLAEHEKSFGSEDVDLKKEFCEFLRTEAYISH